MVKLRDYRKTDVRRLVELANNANVAAYLVDTFPCPYTLEDARWWIQAGARAAGTTKAIEYQGELVGTIGWSAQAGWKSHVAEIGYWLGEAYWGRGIATEALRIMTQSALASGECRKLFAQVLAPNTASMRVLQRNGYRLEGILLNEVVKNGRYYDVLHFAKSAATDDV